MPPTRHFLLLAKLDAEKKRSLGGMATAAKLELSVVESSEAALSWIDRQNPTVVAFDTSLPRAERVCEKVRSKKNLSDVPLLALVREWSDAFTERLYAIGADDVLPLDARAPLLARLKAVPLEPTAVSAANRGRAVIADKDRAHVDVAGRVLSNAGYDVKFATDEVALRFFAQQKEVRVIVASAELGDLAALIDGSRRQGGSAVWVVCAQRRDLEQQREALAGLEAVTVMSSALPAEAVLFASNELLSGSDKAARESPRLLYGATVAFRAAGEDEDELGFTYNVSAGGLYVRTLAPPEGELVWLELRPPKQKRRVRLLGRVAWRRGFGLATAAAAPPGFGVEIREGLGEDLAHWRDGYAALLDRPRTSAPELLVASVKSVPGVVALAAPLGVKVSHAGTSKTPPPLPTATPKAPPAAPAPVPVVEAADVAPEPEAIEFSPEPDPEPDPEPTPEPEPLPPAKGTPRAEPAEPVEARQKDAAPLDSAIVASAPTLGPPSEPPENASAEARGEARGRRGSWLLIALVTVAVLGGGAFAVWRMDGAGKPAVAPTPSRVPATSPAPVASVAPTPTSTAAIASATPAPAEDGAPSTSASVAPPVSAAPPAEDGEDGSKLNWNQGYLLVEASGPADVYATGVKIGPAGTKNVTACGLKYVRLGKGDPPAWVSEGRTVDVKCREVTRVTLELK